MSQNRGRGSDKHDKTRRYSSTLEADNIATRQLLGVIHLTPLRSHSLDSGPENHECLGVCLPVCTNPGPGAPNWGDPSR